MNANQPYKMTEAQSFCLYADDKLATHRNALDEAKSRASEFIRQRKALRIESLVAPAPSSVWRYDYEVYDWVHSTSDRAVTR